MEAVTAVLLDRAREPRGLSRTLAGSLALHALVVLAVVFGPARWLTGTVSNAPRVVMNVSLGGAGRGPDVGGANPLGGRPVQQVATKAPSARPEPVRPPAAKTPAMAAAGPRGREEASREAGEGRTAAARGEVGAGGGRRAGRRSPVRRRSSARVSPRPG